ncbi:MAG: hypothetical protein CL920_16620 [Deltaproteobacteria bacterium]|nr:hypothetical protein [Deltaproteobacteria bacterium]MBU50304.1 hypothetical protein [Deltaproteobacteria bacterium]
MFETHQPGYVSGRFSRVFMRNILVCLLGLGLYVVAEQPVYAQNEQTSFQLQRFRPWSDPAGMFTTQSGKTMGQWNYLAAVFFNYAKDPLTLRFDDGTRNEVLSHQVAADIVLGVGVMPWLDVLLAVPMTLYQVGKLPDDSSLFTRAGADLSGYAFSDLKFAVRGQILKEKTHFVNLGAQAYIGLPTGDQSNFNGEDSVSFGIRLMASKQILPVLNLALNLGYRYLPLTKVMNLVINHELMYSLGGRFELLRNLPNGLDIIADISGATALGDGAALEGAPFDFYIGARYYPLQYKDLAVTLGFGVPLFWPGYGSPQFRVMLGVSWSPKEHDMDKDNTLDHLDRCKTIPGPKANRGCPWPDTDKDGLTDNIDACPKVVGPKANKGCPWPDTDKDGVLDKDDKCPRKPGPKANKGCPWPDTDKDGLKDNVDRCPKKKGPKENKGCPWPDTDKDGVLDKDDKCPATAGPKENKGCPDTDRDKDTVIDRLDKCPDVPGDPKLKGCPKKVMVIVTKKKIRILKKVYFRSGSSRILRRSYALLRQVALVFKSRPAMKVRVEGHTDNRGSRRFNTRLSGRRARSVMKFLVRQGVDKSRLEFKGYGFERPIASNRSRRGRRLNRRVEFTILKQ